MPEDDTVQMDLTELHDGPPWLVNRPDEDEFYHAPPFPEETPVKRILDAAFAKYRRLTSLNGR